MTMANDLVAQLAHADSRKIARWTADRLRHAMRRVSWHAARLRMQVYAAMSHRLPPGSLAASGALRAWTDDRYYLEQLHRHGPIFKLFWGSGHLKICVVGYPLGRRLLNRHRGALQPLTMDITSLVPAEYLRSMSPELHPKYRRCFKGAFRDDLVAGWESELRAIVRRELASLAEPVTPERPSGAHLYATLDRIATRALLLIVFGVGPDAELAPLLEDEYRRLGPDGHIAEVGPAQAAAFHTIREAVLQILQSMRHDQPARFGDSVLHRLVHAGPGQGIDETMIGNAIYLVERGHHDLRDLLRWVLKYLSDHPPLIAELRAGLAEPGYDPQLAEACVLETLRLDQAELLNRRATESFTFEGYHFPRNSRVAILIRESHRDPAAFAEPDAFQPHRFLNRTYSADEYAPFGIDEHQCIGASFVRRMGTLFVEELVKGFTWSVAGDGPRHHGHFHWEPSPSFAIEIRRNR